MQALINAYKECTERRDIAPGKVLRPIGTIFKEWCDMVGSTEIAHWAWWHVKDHFKSFRFRNDNVLFYERMEEIEGIDEPGHE